MLSGKGGKEQLNAAQKVKIAFPNQNNRGAHINVSGGGILKHSPNRENAEKFLDAKARQDIAPAEVPIKKSNFSWIFTPSFLSRSVKKVIEASVLTPPPSIERIYLVFKLNEIYTGKSNAS